jgi:integrase
VTPVAGDPATHPALQRFLLALTARDASVETRRAYATAVGSYLDWLAERGVDWRRPSRTDLRAYLARLGAGAARTTVAQRLAAIRSFHRWAVREGLAPGDPWGAIATPRLPRRLPRVLEADHIDRLLAAIDEEAADAAVTGGPRGTLAVALAQRDAAIVETAYAAGLRISELAAADLGALRSGVNAVPPGQAEAARAIGLTFGQNLRHVVLPQAWRAAIVPLGSVIIAMIKNSAIAGFFGLVGDLSQTGYDLVVARGEAVLPVFVGISLGFLLLTMPLGLLLDRFEKQAVRAR